MGYVIQKYHGKYNTQSRGGTKVKYIVVHYVGAGTSAPGSALANCKYFAGGNRQASAHYFIDDASIYEYADPSVATWHVGDGHGRYGITNNNSIGIEVCNNGGPYTLAEIDRLTWLVQRLMKQYGVPASRVVRHYDASRKMCPLYYAQNPSAWKSLHAQITGGSYSGTGSGTVVPKTIKVDGWWGNDTTIKAQAVLGTPADGIVSSQERYWRDKGILDACTYGWEWTGSPVGSQLIIALQKKWGVDPDGILGPGTINAMIGYYMKRGSGAKVKDGRLDGPSLTVKQFQRELNKGRIG